MHIRDILNEMKNTTRLCVHVGTGIMCVPEHNSEKGIEIYTKCW